MSIAEGNVGAAFGVAIGAGLSTTLGAAMPFIRQVKTSDKRLLAGALAFSSGVMIFVSMCEILQVKAVGSFQSSRASHLNCGDSAACFEGTYGYAVASAYSCFFAGVILTKLVDMLVHRITGGSDEEAFDEIFAAAEAAEKGVQLKDGLPALPMGQAGGADFDAGIDDDQSVTRSEADESGSREIVNEHVRDERDRMEVSDPSSVAKARRDKALQKMSIMAGIALAIHNFPEGLATFAATLSDTSVGASLGFAIAIHNIPEGVVVAMPVYYGTGSKWKAFFWATMSGVAEPIGALFGYIVFVNFFDDLVYALLFSFVAGIMVFIVIGELLPTALRYDSGRIVVPMFFVGAFVMAFSLVIFEL